MEKKNQSGIIRKIQVKSIMRYHFTPLRMAIIKKTRNNAGKSTEKGEFSYAVDGNRN